MLIAAIDVGLVNLGFILAHVSDEIFEIEQIYLAQRIDLTIFLHQRVSKKDCKLHHSRDACDRVQHFLQEYQPYFEEASVVLIERQPITGLTHVEQLIYHCFRDKAILCSPTKMHTVLGMTRGDYDKRKEESIALAAPYLRDLEAWELYADRRHDISDAMCLILFWTRLQQEEKRRIEEQQERNAAVEKSLGTSVDTFFEQFRCPSVHPDLKS